MLWEEVERWSDADPVYTPSINASHFPLSPLIIIIIIIIIPVVIPVKHHHQSHHGRCRDRLAIVVA